MSVLTDTCVRLITGAIAGLRGNAAVIRVVNVFVLCHMQQARSEYWYLAQRTSDHLIE